MAEAVDLNELVKRLQDAKTSDNNTTREMKMKYLYTNPLQSAIDPKHRMRAFKMGSPIDKTYKRVTGLTEMYLDGISADTKPKLNKNYNGIKGDATNIVGWSSMANRGYRIERRGYAVDGGWAKQGYPGYSQHRILQRKPQTSEKTEDSGLKVSDIAIIDKEWVMGKFMTPSEDLTNLDKANRFFSTTGWKFSSTRIGYSLAINARPQFTRYADIKGNLRQAGYQDSLDNADFVKDSDRKVDKATGVKYHDKTKIDPLFQNVGVLPKAPGAYQLGVGMGRYYSEAIDDNATTIFMEFGVPEFNSLLSYFTRAIDPADQLLANKGRIPMMYYFGAAISGFITFCAFPWTTILIWIGKGIVEFFFGGDLNYYYLKPAMHMYWSTVSNIVTQIATELGMLPPFLLQKSNEAGRIGMHAKIDADDIAALSAYSPDIVKSKTGYLDIYAVALRMQKIAIYQSRREYQNYVENYETEGDKKPNANEIMGYVVETHAKDQKPLRYPGEGVFAKIDQTLSLKSFLLRMGNDQLTEHDKTLRMWYDGFEKNVDKAKKMFKSNADGSEDKEDIVPDYQRPPNIPDEVTSPVSNASTGELMISQGEQTFFESMADNFDSAIRDGGQWAIFNVDYQGQVSESISSSVSDINTGGMFKSVAQASRNVKFDLAGGNIIPGMSEMKDQLAAFATGAIGNAAWGLGNAILGLLGGGFVDIPKKWDDSDISLPTINYTMSLVSPYGNMLSQLQNIYIPLAMILAGSLPLKAGQASYTSPFLCSVFNKGIQIVKLGMITSVSINRGTTNLGFNRNKRALGVEVSFTITDFSNVMSAPINSSIFGPELNMKLEDNSKFGQYVAILGSRDIYSMKYSKPKLMLKAGRLLQGVSQAFSDANIGMRLGDTFRPFFGLFVSERKLSSMSQNNGHYE